MNARQRRKRHREDVRRFEKLVAESLRRSLAFVVVGANIGSKEKFEEAISRSVGMPVKLLDYDAETRAYMGFESHASAPRNVSQRRADTGEDMEDVKSRKEGSS